MGSAKATAIFDGDDSRLQAAVKRIDRALLDVEKKFAKMAEFGAKVAAPFVAGAALISAGLIKAFDVGGELHDLSAQTGIAVGDLVVLQQEFREAGKNADDVGKVVGKMQKAIAEGSADDVIRQMGVDLDKLRKMTPTEQFNTLGAAIDGIQNPAQKTAAAMAIFGKEGATMLSMFADKGWQDAALHVGKQAEILNRDAGLFDDVSDKLHTGGLKLQGFFVGMADRVAGTLEPFLDKFAATDFAEEGQEFGDALALGLQSITDGTLGDIMKIQLTIGAVEFVNFLAGAMLSLPAILDDGLQKAAATFIAMMLDGTSQIIGAASNIPGLGITRGAAGIAKNASQAFSDRSSQIDLGATVQKAMERGQILDTSALNDWLGELLQQTSDHADVSRAKALALHPQKQPKPGDAVLDFGSDAQTGISALQRIGGAFGGGGGAEALLSEAQRQTEHLASIDAKLSSRDQPRAAATATYG